MRRPKGSRAYDQPIPSPLTPEQKQAVAALYGKDTFDAIVDMFSRASSPGTFYVCARCEGKGETADIAHTGICPECKGDCYVWR